MKIKALVFALVLSTASFAASAADRVFEFLPAEGQELIYQDGVAYLLLKGQKFSMAAGLEENDGKRGWVGLVISNLDSAPVTVFDNLLAAESNTKPLKVYNYDALKAEIDRAARMRAFGAALAAAGNSMSASAAGYQRQSGTYRANTQVYGPTGGNYGSATTTGTYSGTTYDQGAVKAAQDRADEKNRQLMSSISQQTAAAKGDLQSRVLRTNTVNPGESIGGSLQFDLPKKNKKDPAVVRMTTTVGGETFTFELREKFP